MKAISFFSFFLIVFTCYAQDKWEVGVLFSPSISQIDEQSYTKYYDPIYPVNAGIRVSCQYRRFNFSYGLLHLTQGKKYHGEVSTTSFPEGGIATLTQKTKIKGLFIPLNVNYFLLDKKNIGSYVGAGLYTGYIYSQIFDPVYVDPGNIRIVDMLYLGVNIDVGVAFRLSHHFSIIFSPNILYQLRKEIPHENFPAYTPKLCTMSFDLGFYYRLGKKEKAAEEK